MSPSLSASLDLQQLSIDEACSRSCTPCVRFIASSTTQHGMFVCGCCWLVYMLVTCCAVPLVNMDLLTIILEVMKAFLSER
jgi:hypothetical protein